MTHRKNPASPASPSHPDTSRHPRLREDDGGGGGGQRGLDQSQTDLVETLSARAAILPTATAQPVWTPARMRYFLSRLADTGNVLGVCQEIGLSRQSVYGLRVRDAAFARAWEGAVLRHRDALVDLCMERATVGVTEEVVIDGALVERTKPDGVMLRHMLGRADRICADDSYAARPARQSELHFETLLDCLDPPEQMDGDCAGEVLPDREALLADIEASARWDWEAVSAEELFAHTEPAPELGPGMRIGKAKPVRGYASDEEAVEALVAYKRIMATPPDEVDISDLDEAEVETWTDEQWLRADHSGLAAGMFEDEESGFEDGVDQQAGEEDP